MSYRKGDDPVLDGLLEDFPDGDRGDPDLHAMLRGTFAYQSRKLDAEARALGIAGRLAARKFRRRLRARGIRL